MTSTQKEEFQILTAREHCRRRIAVYMGSPATENLEQFVLGKWSVVKYNPAVFKMINEIIDNSVDEGIRTGFKFANKISVVIDENRVTVTDNGRGIPQDLVFDSVSGEKISRPVAAWTRTNAGSSFSDERTSMGANGVGSSVTNFLSIEFTGKTWRQGKQITVDCKNGAETIVVSESKKSGSGTTVEFVPDFTLFQDISNFDETDTIDLVEDRLRSLAIAFPEISFSFNGKEITERNLKRYSEMFADGGSVLLYENKKITQNLGFFLMGSSDGFRSSSYVNGLHNRLGGSYVDHVINGILDELLPAIKKKFKFEISKSVAKGNLGLIIFARNFVNPRFDSQTKERLTNSGAEVRAHYQANEIETFQKIAKQIMGTPDLIDPIVAAQVAKRDADALRDAAKAQKGLRKVKVAKHVAATSKSAMLVLGEGDSALSTAISVRDPAKIGLFPLRGVVMNSWSKNAAETLKNKEYAQLTAILGLDINDPDSWKDAHYSEVGLLVDMDPDGNHIAALLVGFFKNFWPGMIAAGKIKRLVSPLLISTKGKEVSWIYDLETANEFKKNNPGHYHRYIKGLGSLTKEEFSVVLNAPYAKVITEEEGTDYSTFYEIMLGDSADVRKKFMMGAEIDENGKFAPA